MVDSIEHLDLIGTAAPGAAPAVVPCWAAAGSTRAARRNDRPLIAWPQASSTRPTRRQASGSPVLGPAAAKLAVGDTVWLRHAKAGELAERVASYAVVGGSTAR